MSDNGLITIVTPTVGNGSPRRLLYLLREMRQFTKLDYEHIVCDDGTISPGTHAIQREICKLYGAKFILNPGPRFGASFALNLACKQVKTRWFYIVDDGCRPSNQWLEAAVEFVRNTGESLWNKRRVAMAGALAIAQPMLAIADIFGEDRLVDDYIQSGVPWKPFVVEDFYGDWNDGLWNWERMAPRVCKRILRNINPSQLEIHYRTLMMRLLEGVDSYKDPKFRQNIMELANMNHWGGFWPNRRVAEMSYYSTPLALVNLELFNKVGRFRDFCWLYEGHLAIRFGLAGHLVLMLEQPPWLHLSNQASFDAQSDGHQPRPKMIDEVFRSDFGFAPGEGHPLLIDKVISLQERIEINKQLAAHPIRELMEVR